MGESRESVVVTGVSSFIGTHLAKTFQSAGYDVVGTLGRHAHEYTGVRAQRIEYARNAGVSLRVTDLRDASAVTTLISRVHPSLWVQHAGWAKDYGSLDYDLAAGFDANVLALTGIYRALSEFGCRRVLVSGSSAEYSDSDQANHEEDACWPSTPYGLAKLAETIRSRQLALRYGLRTRVARIYIPFGPIDAPGKLFSAVLDGLSREEPVELSQCTQYRDFIHVEELAKAYLLMAKDCSHGPLFEIYNLCSGVATRLNDLLMSLIKEVGASPALLRFGAKTMRPGESPVSFGSADKAAASLGWRAPPLAEMLQAFISTEIEGRTLR